MRSGRSSPGAFTNWKRAGLRAIPCGIIVDEARWLLGIGAMFGRWSNGSKRAPKRRSAHVALDPGNGGLAQHRHLAGGGGSMPIRLLLPNAAALSAEVLPLYAQLGCPGTSGTA